MNLLWSECPRYAQYTFLGMVILKGFILSTLQTIKKPMLMIKMMYTNWQIIGKHFWRIALMSTQFVPVTTRIMIPWTGAIENIKSPFTQFNVRLTLGTLKPIKKAKMWYPLNWVLPGKDNNSSTVWVWYQEQYLLCCKTRDLWCLLLSKTHHHLLSVVDFFSILVWCYFCIWAILHDRFLTTGEPELNVLKFRWNWSFSFISKYGILSYHG